MARVYHCGMGFKENSRVHQWELISEIIEGLGEREMQLRLRLISVILFEELSPRNLTLSQMDFLLI